MSRHPIEDDFAGAEEVDIVDWLERQPETDPIRSDEPPVNFYGHLDYTPKAVQPERTRRESAKLYNTKSRTSAARRRIAYVERKRSHE